MKIRINIDESLPEDEVVINCSELNRQITDIQKAIKEITYNNELFTFFKSECEYYLPLECILFFETDCSNVQAHTKEDIYSVRHKLYELEELLPTYFMRISKSTILNTKKIYGINRSITSSVTIEFLDTCKQVYVSRLYYKQLKNRLDEKRKIL